MADVTLEFIGLKELELVLKEMPDQFNYKFLTGAHKEILKKTFLKAAQDKCPIGTKSVHSKKYESRSHAPGNLKASLGVGLAPRSRKLAGVWAGARSRAVFRKGLSKADGYYANMVEFGHKGVPPQPFMRPAFDETKNQMKDMVSSTLIDRMKKLIKKYARRQSS